MSIAVVYYSLSGNTQYVAETLAQHLDARTVPLRERGNRSGFFGFMKSGFQASLGLASNLEGDPWDAVTSADVLYLATPLWAAKPSPAMNAFVNGGDFAGTRVYAVTLQADPRAAGSEKAHRLLRERLEKRGATVAEMYAVQSAPPGRFAGRDHLHAQVVKIVGGSVV